MNFLVEDFKTYRRINEREKTDSSKAIHFAGGEQLGPAGEVHLVVIINPAS